MIEKKEKLVVANFKMNLSARYELVHWMDNFSRARKGIRFSKTSLILCPPITHFDFMARSIRSKYVSFGAQNCFWEQKGSYTGEVSPRSLYDFGARFIILGHSERRKYLGESNQIVAIKLEAALKAGLVPILCIGETAEQKKKGQTMQVIKSQLQQCLGQLGKAKIEKIIFCYEPVWAISSNNPDHVPSSNGIMEARLVIKKYLADNLSRLFAERARIIYGGSVGLKNVKEVCIDSGMDGGLIGRASLSPHDLIKVAQVMDGQ